MYLQFHTTSEHYVIWDKFEKEHKRESWRCPKIKEGETQKWPAYRDTAKFQFCAETFRMWYLYAEKHLKEIELLPKGKLLCLLEEYKKEHKRLLELRESKRERVKAIPQRSLF